MSDADAFVPYIVILVRGALSPAEDLETALVAAGQSEACGEPVARIERGAEIVLEGDALRAALTQHPATAR